MLPGAKVKQEESFSFVLYEQRKSYWLVPYLPHISSHGCRYEFSKEAQKEVYGSLVDSIVGA